MAEESLGGQRRKPGKDKAQWEGRCRFLWAVERFRATLRHLEGTPLEAFANAHAETRPPPYEKPPGGPFGAPVPIQEDPPWVRWRFEKHDWDVDLNDQDPLVAELHREILSWGERRHLTDPWLMDVALRSLRFWHHGQLKGRFVLPSFIDTDDREKVVLNGWTPPWETRSAYEERVQREFDEYMDKTEARAESHGMKPGIKKRGADVGKHFKWLARYQIGEKSYETIAKDLGVHPTTVAKAVRKTAKLIDLELRHVSRGGRKPPS